ncbi:hypothetical protein U3516DRAFT_775045 [Neocallimastix sp. 'constans']
MVSYLCGNASIPLDSNLDIETLKNDQRKEMFNLMNEEKDKNIEKLDIKNFHPMIMLLTICNLRKEKSNDKYWRNFQLDKAWDKLKPSRKDKRGLHKQWLGELDMSTLQKVYLNFEKLTIRTYLANEIQEKLYNIVKSFLGIDEFNVKSNNDEIDYSIRDLYTTSLSQNFSINVYKRFTLGLIHPYYLNKSEPFDYCAPKERKKEGGDVLTHRDKVNKKKKETIEILNINILINSRNGSLWRRRCFLILSYENIVKFENSNKDLKTMKLYIEEKEMLTSSVDHQNTTETEKVEFHNGPLLSNDPLLSSSSFSK